MSANEKLILALPNGRILEAVMPLLNLAGILPEREFDNPATRQLRSLRSSTRISTRWARRVSNANRVSAPTASVA